MHPKVLKLVGLVAVLALIGWGVYAIVSAPKPADTQIISEHGDLHVRAHLSIIVHGTPAVIPANIGLPASSSSANSDNEAAAFSTHDDSGIIYADFNGLVTADQLRLGNFFSAWGKDFSKDSILGNKEGDGGTITMTVNGKPNTDFENYIITGKGTYNAGSLGMIDDIVINFQ